MNSITTLEIPLSTHHYPYVIAFISVGIIGGDFKDALNSRELIESINQSLNALFQEPVIIYWKRLNIDYKNSLTNSRLHFIVNGSGRLLKSFNGFKTSPIDFYKDIKY